MPLLSKKRRLLISILALPQLAMAALPQSQPPHAAKAPI